MLCENVLWSAHAFCVEPKLNGARLLCYVWHGVEYQQWCAPNAGFGETKFHYTLSHVVSPVPAYGMHTCDCVWALYKQKQNQTYKKNSRKGRRKHQMILFPFGRAEITGPMQCKHCITLNTCGWDMRRYARDESRHVFVLCICVVVVCIGCVSVCVRMILLLLFYFSLVFCFLSFVMCSFFVFQSRAARFHP